MPKDTKYRIYVRDTRGERCPNFPPDIFYLTDLENKVLSPVTGLAFFEPLPSIHLITKELKPGQKAWVGQLGDEKLIPAPTFTSFKIAEVYRLTEADYYWINDTVHKSQAQHDSARRIMTTIYEEQMKPLRKQLEDLEAKKNLHIRSFGNNLQLPDLLRMYSVVASFVKAKNQGPDTQKGKKKK